jgi:hypothetical protein
MKYISFDQKKKREEMYSARDKDKRRIERLTNVDVATENMSVAVSGSVVFEGQRQMVDRLRRGVAVVFFS